MLSGYTSGVAGFSVSARNRPAGATRPPYPTIVPVPPDQSWLKDVVARVLPEAGDTYRHVERRDDAAWVANRLAEILPLALGDKQALLELADPLERLAALEPAVARDPG